LCGAQTEGVWGLRQTLCGETDRGLVGSQKQIFVKHTVGV